MTRYGIDSDKAGHSQCTRATRNHKSTHPPRPLKQENICKPQSGGWGPPLFLERGTFAHAKLTLLRFALRVMLGVHTLLSAPAPTHGQKHQPKKTHTCTNKCYRNTRPQNIDTTQKHAHAHNQTCTSDITVQLTSQLEGEREWHTPTCPPTPARTPRPPCPPPEPRRRRTDDYPG